MAEQCSAPHPCPILQEARIRLAQQEEQIANLTGWQQTQNGNLTKMVEKLDRMRDEWALAAKVLSDRVDANLSRVNSWLVGLLGSALLAVILLALNLALAALGKRP